MKVEPCGESELGDVAAIINAAAEAYRGVIPADRWHEPYMDDAELRREVADGVVFWGVREEGRLVGVMGVQDRGDVTLIRHAYVRPDRQRRGIGAALLAELRRSASGPVLIGTWAAASWAIAFYERRGFRRVDEAEKDRLLRRYWRVPERQIEESVVLADEGWGG